MDNNMGLFEDVSPSIGKTDRFVGSSDDDDTPE